MHSNNDPNLSVFPQILQMIVTFLVIVYAARVKGQGGQCDLSDGVVQIAMFLAVAYTVLFGWFFVNAYVWKSNRRSVKDKSS